MPTVLNQVIAVEPTRKKQATQELTDAYKLVQKDVWGGMVREYTPREDGQGLPSESKKVQVTVFDMLAAVAPSNVKYWDLAATKEVGNSQAKADVVIDGQVIIKEAPVSFLLFLQARLDELRAFISKIPVLSQDKEWEFDPQVGLFRSDTVKTTRSVERPKAITLAPATPEHPAQTQVYNEAVVVGEWSTTSLSSAIPPHQREEALTRLNTMIEAVKVAREKANATQVEDQHIAQPVWDYIFSPIAPPA